jgi:hypothetical protein
VPWVSKSRNAKTINRKEGGKREEKEGRGEKGEGAAV